MPRSDTPHLHQTVTNPTTIKLEWAQSQRELFEVRTIAVRDYFKGIMQAEPFAKVLACFKLTGLIRKNVTSANVSRAKERTASSSTSF
jgi:hypothetical protein